MFGDSKSERREKRIIKKGYENFAFILLETIRVIFIPKDEYDARFTLINEENVWKSLNKEGQAITLCMHFGYWEAVGTTLAQYYKDYGRGVWGV